MLALPEVDAIFISLPIDKQPEVVLAALRAGKPVISEKPVAPSLAVGRRLVKTAAKLPTPWLVGENFAFMSHVEKLKGWIDDGRLGEVRLVQVFQMTYMDSKNPYFNTTWRAKPAHVGGFVVDGGVHMANIVRRCFGMPEVLRGLVGSFEPKLPPIDTAVSVMRFESGALGTWTSCFSVRYDGPILRIYGSRANAELTWDTASLKGAKGKETKFVNNRNSFSVQLEHFRDVVLRGATPRVSPEEALADLEFVERLSVPK
jgi:predicted dehydrogenase